MKLAIGMLVSTLLCAQAAFGADSLRGPIEAEPSAKVVEVVPAKQSKHPRWHKVERVMTCPVRATYHGCVKIGKMSQPIQPFLSLCGSLGSAAAPVVLSVMR